jgi:hypothetical protein
MDERGSSKDREETDLHVRRNTAIKISDGHITITPLYMWTVGIWRQRNVTAVGTTEMFMSWWYLQCLSLCSTYLLLHLCKYACTYVTQTCWLRSPASTNSPRDIFLHNKHRAYQSPCNCRALHHDTGWHTKCYLSLAIMQHVQASLTAGRR